MNDQAASASAGAYEEDYPVGSIGALRSAARLGVERRFFNPYHHRCDRSDFTLLLKDAFMYANAVVTAAVAVKYRTRIVGVRPIDSPRPAATVVGGYGRVLLDPGTEFVTEIDDSPPDAAQLAQVHFELDAALWGIERLFGGQTPSDPPFEDWPRSPGTCCGHCVGRSAAGAILAFVRDVHLATSFDQRDVARKAWVEPPGTGWANAIVQNLKQIVPPPSEWPRVHLGRTDAIVQRLEDEAKATPDKPTPAETVVLSDMERNIIEALAHATMTGEDLAKAAGYPCNSNFKTALSSLRRRRILGNRAPGYFLEPDYYYLLGGDHGPDQGQD